AVGYARRERPYDRGRQASGNVRKRLAWYHEGVAVDRFVHLCGIVPGNDPRADRSGDHGQARRSARAEGKRDRWSSDSGWYGSRVPQGTQEQGTVRPRAFRSDRSGRVVRIRYAGTPGRRTAALRRVSPGGASRLGSPASEAAQFRLSVFFYALLFCAILRMRWPNG